MSNVTLKINKKNKDRLKKANTAMGNIAKDLGESGGTGLVGKVEKLNKGFRDTERVAKLYKNFNKSLNTLKSELNEVDRGFQAIDSVI